MIPILIDHEWDKEPIGFLKYADTILVADFPESSKVTRYMFFAIFGNVGARVTSWSESGYVLSAEILEFSLPVLSEYEIEVNQ